MKNNKVLAFLFAATGIFFITSMYGRMQISEPIAPVEPMPLLQTYEPSTIFIKPGIKQRKRELIQQIKQLTKKIDTATKNKDRLQRQRDMLKRQLKEL